MIPVTGTGVITSITPSPRKPDRVSIRVDGRAVAILGKSQVQALKLCEGQPWDDTVAGRVSDAVQFDRALAQAMRHVNRRPQSRARLMEKLRAQGQAPSMAERVCDRLESLGALGDEALGRELIHEILSQKPAGPAFLAMKLRRHGLEEALAERLAAEALDQDDLARQAQQLARRERERLPGLSPRRRTQRIWGLLARRGFDQETIQEALESLGEAGEEPWG